jgi:deoxyribonuclease-2
LYDAGVLGVDANLAGFWLVHSTPRTPEGPTDSASYPGILDNEIIYGQSFLCISIEGSETLNTIAEALYLDWPNVYDQQLSSAVSAAAPTLVEIAAGKHSSSASCVHSDIKSVAGASFTVFAKSGSWGQELYSDCIAPALAADVLYVESWIRGDMCPPTCGDHQVLDVDSVHAAGWGWRETQDHSKWAVTGSGSMGCMGDINRMTSQAKRGGGSVCGSVLGQAMLGVVGTLKDGCGNSSNSSDSSDSNSTDPLPRVARGG